MCLGMRLSVINACVCPCAICGPALQENIRVKKEKKSMFDAFSI